MHFKERCAGELRLQGLDGRKVRPVVTRPGAAAGEARGDTLPVFLCLVCSTAFAATDSACALCVHCLFFVFPLPLPCVSTAFAATDSACALCVHCLFFVFPLPLPCVSTAFAATDSASAVLLQVRQE